MPETFRVVRKLLDRVDDSQTGDICPELLVDVPEKKMEEAKFMADKCGDSMFKKYSVHPGVECCN